MAQDISRRTLFLTYGALLVLLALTLGATQLDLGVFNPVANLGIAGIKAALVLWVFMHLTEATPMVRLFALGSLFWLTVMLVLGLGDWLTRAGG